MQCTVMYLLCCTVPKCIKCTVLYCTVLYFTVLYCTELYFTVLNCTLLYCTVLYCTVSVSVSLPSQGKHHQAGFSWRLLRNLTVDPVKIMTGIQGFWNNVHICVFTRLPRFMWGFTIWLWSFPVLGLRELFLKWK